MQYRRDGAKVVLAAIKHESPRRDAAYPNIGFERSILNATPADAGPTPVLARVARTPAAPGAAGKR
jgi:hypothetical protein